MNLSVLTTVQKVYYCIPTNGQTQVVFPIKYICMQEVIRTLSHGSVFLTSEAVSICKHGPANYTSLSLL